MELPVTRTLSPHGSTPVGEATVVHRRPGLMRPDSSCILDGELQSTLEFPLRFGETARPVPKSIGAYQIVREVGAGGMGVVYEGFDPRLKRRAAIKMIRGGLSVDAMRRFQTEAEAVAQAHHPNIVQIYEVGVHDGQPFVALEYLGGGSLYSKASNKPQPPDEAADTVRVLAEAMQHAHEAGVIHRDLKPANVLYSEDGDAKITDFGAARLTIDSADTNAAGSAVTQIGEVIGTPQYMAPEQARGTPLAITPAVDVYALGAMLYHLLTGRPPHDGPDSYDVITAVLKNDPVPPRRLVPRIPRDLETVCLKALEKHPANRYRSAGAMAEDLARYRSGDSIAAKPDPTVVRLWRKARRHPAITGLAAGIIVVALAGLSGIVWQLQKSIAARNEAMANAQEAMSARLDADAKAIEATEHARQAEISRKVADAARRQAESDRDRKNKALIRSQISEAALMMENSDIVKAQNRLINVREAHGFENELGWEWHYLDRLGNNRLWNQTMMRPESDEALWAATMAVSPDGTRIAVSGGNPYFRPDDTWDTYAPAQLDILDMRSGRVLLRWPDYAQERVDFLTWLDADRVLACPRFQSPMVLNVKTHQVEYRWPCVEGPPVCDCFERGLLSPNGKLMVKATGTRSAGVWDTATRQFVGEITLPGEAPVGDARGSILYPADISNEGWVYVHRPQEAAIVNAYTGRVLLHLRGESISGVAYDAPRRRMTIRRGYHGQPQIRLEEYDLDTGTRRWSRVMGHSDRYDGMMYTLDGQSLLVCDNGTSAILAINTTDGQTRSELRGHTSRIWGTAMSPDGRWLVTSANDATVRVWHIEQGIQIACYRGHTTGARCVTFAPNGWQILSGGMDAIVIAWDFSRERAAGGALPDFPGRRNDGGAFTGGLWCTADGEGLLLDTVTGALIGFDPWTLTPTRRTFLEGMLRRAEKSATDFDLSPDGKYLIGPANHEGSVALCVWDSQTGKVLRRFPDIGHRIVASAISADGQYAAATAVVIGDRRVKSREFRVWNVRSGEEIRRDSLGEMNYTALAFRPGTTELYMGVYTGQSKEKGLRIMDVTKPKDVRTVDEEHSTFLRQIIFSTDGRTLLAMDHAFRNDNRSVIWMDLPECRIKWRHVTAQPLTGLALSPDRRRVAVARHDDAVTVLDAEDGSEVLPLSVSLYRLGDYAFPSRAAFTPDGKGLMAIGSSGQVSVWLSEPVTKPGQPPATRYREAANAAFAFHYRAAWQLRTQTQGVAWRFHAKWLDTLKAPNDFMAREWSTLKNLVAFEAVAW